MFRLAPRLTPSLVLILNPAEKQAILEERKLEARLLRALELIKEQVRNPVNHVDALAWEVDVSIGTWLGSNSSLPIVSITEGCRGPWSSHCLVLRSIWLELMCCLSLCVVWQVEVISLSSKITSEVEGKILNRQREAFLRQQVRADKPERTSLSS